MIKILIKRLPHGQDLPLPRYMSHSAAGMDLLAAVEKDTVIKKGARMLIPTGISMALPSGYEAQVRPRSGLALKHGITILNTPGTIDEDYRGEVGVILANLGEDEFIVKRGDRIAQLIVSPVVQAELEEVGKLPESHRNEGGFGHTGK